jgi:hypothetical protein
MTQQPDEIVGTEWGQFGFFGINFMPSTTEVVNIPIDFGAPGMAAAAIGTSRPITYAVDLSDGTDTGVACLVNIIGDFVSAEILVNPS